MFLPVVQFPDKFILLVLRKNKRKSVTVPLLEGYCNVTVPLLEGYCNITVPLLEGYCYSPIADSW